MAIVLKMPKRKRRQKPNVIVSTIILKYGPTRALNGSML